MSGIFGAVELGGVVDTGATIHRMSKSYRRNPFDRIDHAESDTAAFGRALNVDTPEAEFDRLPLASGGDLFSAAARIDNRSELLDQLAIPPSEQAGLSDAGVLHLAFRKWGIECCARLRGEWAFAAWCQSARRLTLARDLLGTTPLYYAREGRSVCFSSLMPPLLAGLRGGAEVDELFVAGILIAWTPADGSTAYRGVRRVIGGTHVSIDESGEHVASFYNWNAFPEIRLPNHEDYALGLRDVFDRAVKQRLRSQGRVAVTLSGGLDSGAVAASASMQLSDRRGLLALSHVPRFPRELVDPGGDERHRIRLQVEAAGIGQLELVDSSESSPLAGIREALEIHRVPLHAASNQFWILDLMRRAADCGASVLLSGQAGNATISWGKPADLRNPVAGSRGIEGLLSWARSMAVGVVRRGRSLIRAPWEDHSAINPRLAKRLRLADRVAGDAVGRSSGIADRVAAVLYLPGQPAEKAMRFGLTLTDPTADQSVFEFCMGMPIEQYGDVNGEHRWLLRRAFRGRMPAEVLDQPVRGYQAGDVFRRLQEDRAEVMVLLERWQRTAVAEFVDIPLVSAVVAGGGGDRRRHYRQTTAVVLRGVMTGLFLESVFGAGSNGE